MDVIGFGAFNVDYIYEVEDLSQVLIAGKPCEPGGEMFCAPDSFGEVQKVLAEKKARLASRSPGGSAANTVLALARMGFKTGAIGKVGRDEGGKFLLAGMKGVDASHVKTDGTSGQTVILLDKERERTILVFPGANDELTFDELDLGYIRKAEFLHLTSFAGEVPTEAQRRLVEAVRDAVKITFDPGEIHTQKGLVKMQHVISHSDTVFVTDREVHLLTGEDYNFGTRELLNYGPKTIVCKLGPRGSYVLSREEEFHVPPTPAEPVVDRTGAGDVYAAGFLAGRLKGLNLMECAMLATKAAAQSITGWGREKYPDASILTGL